MTLAILLVTAAMGPLIVALPISQNHRFAIYTPYWHQGSQPQLPQEFSQKRFNCGSTICPLDKDLIHDLPRNDLNNNIPLFKTIKRNKNYKTGWTMGGMPFSVLYMNPKPKISVRSPIAEPLHAAPPNYDNSELLMREPSFLPEERNDDYVQEVQAQPLTSALEGPMPTLIPTRRQYSIIPQLFVSYGWGPLGK